MRILIGLIISLEILDASCMEQHSRITVGGVDNDFFQRQWELQQSPVTHFTPTELQSIYDETNESKKDMRIPEDPKEAECLLSLDCPFLPSELSCFREVPRF